MKTKKHRKRSKSVDPTVNVSKDFPWKVFAKLVEDLEFTAAEQPAIFGAIRNRSYQLLRGEITKNEPRSMLEEGLVQKSDADKFFRRYQLGAFLKKYPFPGEDTVTPAMEKFYQAERACRLYNSENYKAIVRLNSDHPEYFGVLDEIRDDIEKLIGAEPPLSSVYEHSQHGPGVSLGDQYKRGRCTSYYKWSALPYSVTEGARPYAEYAICSDPRWVGALHDQYHREKSLAMWTPVTDREVLDWCIEVKDGSRITTVPKTAETDRTIAIEPLLNVYLQLGVDHVIKDKLRLWGYDLTSQEKNQLLAREGSLSGQFATLDLSMASDTISLRVAQLLLPPLWFNLLIDLRCPKGKLGHNEIIFEKLSSMGNGFTFAIETLIFGAIVRYAIKKTKSARKSAVYGDDLVVPVTAVALVTELLGYFGFSLNKDKSFSEGPFRESCGQDFFFGYNVRPVYWKEAIKDVTQMYYLHNILLTLERRVWWAFDVDLSGTRAWIRKRIPNSLRECYGPITECLDSHLHLPERDLERDHYGQQTYEVIKPSAVRFTSGHTRQFFFRKLMATLKPDAATSNKGWLSSLLFHERRYAAKWEIEQLRKRMNTGNAFDVTRRDTVRYSRTRCVIP